MKEVKWLHISDLHCNPKEGFDTSLAKKKLIDFFEKNYADLSCDYIFITGDIADRGNYSDVENFIKKLIKSVCTNYSPYIIWVPGNHDIKRKKYRTQVIKEIRESENSSVRFATALIDEEENALLNSSGMKEFYNNYTNITGYMFKDDNTYEINSNRYYEFENINVIAINTSLLTIDDNDRDNIYITDKEVLILFSKIKNKKPYNSL